jgi:steroid delta-isomerase-like uncharacterized protein
MASERARTALGVFSSWEARKFDDVASNMSDEVVYEDKPRGDVMKGPDETKAWFASWAEACPDSVANARVIGESDDTVVIEGLWEGTNEGPLGPMPATGKRVVLPFINILRFGQDGRVVGGAAYYDQLSMLIQLGHAEPPG